LAAQGLPTEAALNYLAPFRDSLPSELFTQEHALPKTDGSGNNRHNQRRAMALFKEAGYELANGKMVEKATKKPLTVTLLSEDHRQERLLIPYKKSLADLGVDLNLQILDKSLFRKKVREFDFDMVDWYFWQSTYPGTELYNSWSSDMAMEKNSGNVTGVSHPAIDALLEQVSKANTYEALIPIGQALDRVLLTGHYVIPKWYSPYIHLAYWNHLDHPPQANLYWLDLNNWWQKPANEKAINLKVLK
jgi:microcin C transport system substrate-binding protein